ncbi:MAG: hypothetical protein SGI86_12820 [Deltaproteobacteria bacterium]|nr:hypothetical protein [Deltaproteobacteria bacterium]
MYHNAIRGLVDETGQRLDEGDEVRSILGKGGNPDLPVEFCV